MIFFLNILFYAQISLFPRSAHKQVSTSFKFKSICMNQKKVIKIEQMTNDQLSAWNSLFNSWMQHKFFPQLKKLHYKQDCIDCGDIYFITRFNIDNKGLVTNYEIIREEIDCRNKTEQENNKLKKVLVQGFSSWIFPEILHDLIIEARMGFVTRC
jgi:hypothetical protein